MGCLFIIFNFHYLFKVSIFKLETLNHCNLIKNSKLKIIKDIVHNLSLQPPLRDLHRLI